MRTTLLAAFDGAVSEVLAEAAARAGVAAPPAAGGDGDATMGDGDDDGDAADAGGGAAFRVGTAGFDSAAFVAAGLSCEEIAAQYVRAVAEQTAAVGDGARLEAVEKWMHERAERRLLQDELQELKGSIRVLCRQRPLAAHEGESATSVPTDGEIRLVERGHARGFTFDHVFGAGAAQAEVFSEVEPVIDSVLRGFNVCILAYGQTGSGKTFTMEGKPNDEALAGINRARPLPPLRSDRRAAAARARGRRGGEGRRLVVVRRRRLVPRDIQREAERPPREGGREEGGAQDLRVG